VLFTARRLPAKTTREIASSFLDAEAKFHYWNAP
jgi:hypothetical protein